MGPQASAYLYNLLIEKAISDYGVKKDEDFPEIIIYSVAVPDFISDRNQSEKALIKLKERINEINKLEISSLSIACNTAHLLLPKLQQISKIPFISVITEVVRKVKEERIGKIGILGTPTTIKSPMYQAELRKRSVKFLLPLISELLQLERVIRNVIAGQKLQEDRKILLDITMRMEANGAEGIILGCTELPLIFPKKFDLPVFSSLDILAVALLEKYYGKR